MTQENSYFQLEIRENTSVLHIYPRTGSGETADFDEIIKYLQGLNYADLPLKDIKAAVNSLQSDEQTVVLGISDGLEIAGDMFIKVSLDKMKVTARFYSPSFGGKSLSVSDVINNLRSYGVTYGIDNALISQILSDKIYCTSFVIAQGDPPDHGRDAKIEYFFETDLSKKPRQNEDGSVDFFSLNTISHIEQDQLLARLHPCDRGRSGMDVCGKEVRPRTVKDLKLSGGANMRMSDDGLELYSLCNGHASVIDNKILVSSELSIEGNVDVTTGNVDYKGSVHITGNVCEGFTVIADGDVVVDGVVEGANIACGGQVIIRRGVQGQGKVVIRAESNILCKFIENGEISSGGYVEAESIVNSTVSASGDVIVHGKRGLVVGSLIRAGGKISVVTVGTEMGGASRLEVGVDPSKKERFLDLQRNIGLANAEIMKLEPVLTTYQRAIEAGRVLNDKQNLYLQQILSRIQTLKNNLKKDQEEMGVLQQTILRSNNANITVSRDAFPGTVIQISDLSMTVKSKRSCCQFKKKFGEIEVTNV